MRTSDRLAEWIGRLRLSQGPLAGQRFQVLEWQRRLLGLFDTPGDCDLSLARGQGKSTFLAAIATAAVHPEGPLHQPRGDVIVCAGSVAQASIVWEHTARLLWPSGHPGRGNRDWRCVNNHINRTIEFKPTGARVRCISSDPRRAHGLAPSLTICDEPSAWPITKSAEMISVLTTASGKILNSRLVTCGTRSADPAHWFERRLKGPRAICYAAAKDDDPFDPATWLKANPALPEFPWLQEVIAREAKDAKEDGALLASFRALRLNQGVSPILESLVVSARSWERAEGGVEAEAKGPYIMGVDLSGGVAVSALAAFHIRTGRLDAIGAFPAKPDLKERGRLDGVADLYVQQADRDELLTLGSRTVDYTALLRAGVGRWGKPGAVVGDHFRVRELKDALEAAGIRAPLVTRKIGWKDGAEDLRAFRRAVMERTVRPVKSLLLRSAVAEARTASDTAGNERLALRTQSGRRALARDDALAAAILAVAHGRRVAGRPKRKRARILVCR